MTGGGGGEEFSDNERETPKKSTRNKKLSKTSHSYQLRNIQSQGRNVPLSPSVKKSLTNPNLTDMCNSSRIIPNNPANHNIPSTSGTISPNIIPTPNSIDNFDRIEEAKDADVTMDVTDVHNQSDLLTPILLDNKQYENMSLNTSFAQQNLYYERKKQL